MQNLRQVLIRNCLCAVGIIFFVSLPSTAIAKSKRIATEDASLDAARYLIINTSVIKQVVESAAVTQSSLDLQEDYEKTELGEQDQSKRISKRVRADGFREVRESILYEINHARLIANELSSEAPELARLVEPENWVMVNDKLQSLTSTARKRLPKLTRRMKSGHYATWARAMLPPLDRVNTSNTKLYNEFSEFRRWLDEFDPMLTDRRQQVTRATELIAAIRNNDLDQVEKLVDTGMMIGASEFPLAESPVSAALSIQNDAMLSYILSKGAISNPLDRLIALETSANDYPALFSRLLVNAEFPNQHRVNEKIRRITDILFRKKRVLEMKLWIATLADVTRLQNQLGDSYLFELVEAKDIEFLTMFLKAGANPNVDTRHASLLTVALATRNLEVIDLLIEYKVDLNRPSQQGSKLSSFDAFLANTEFTPHDWPMIQHVAPIVKIIFNGDKVKTNQTAERISQQTGVPTDYVLSVLQN